MNAIFKLCRSNQWHAVLKLLEEEPNLALHPISMNNHIITTIGHQVITSKGPMEVRAAILRHILTHAPKAAALSNGYGSLLLHVITQRNTKLKSTLKEDLIRRLIKAYPEALLITGGVGKRSPLHIVFTDYVSPDIVELMVNLAPKACFITDKKGYLAAHVACSRHCSPAKLQMLLTVNPDALYAKTNAGDTLLSLAKSTATKTHPNYRLISAIQDHLRVADGKPNRTTVPSSLPLKKRKPAGALAPPKKRIKAEDSASLLLHFSRSVPSSEDCVTTVAV